MTVEQKFKKQLLAENILSRPDLYIGCVEHVLDTMWVYEKDQNSIIQRQVNYVPGLYKIFDEILVNAADNKQRDKAMNMIKIEIDAEKNVISIWNNGQGIPVAIHKHHDLYIPELIFGHLMTSSHYNNSVKELTGGRNGCGAKLCNIFSSSFTVETATKQYGKKYKQMWVNNMSKVTPPEIEEFCGTDFTRVTFSPDLKKLNMECLDEDIVSLMSRRAYDIAATTKDVEVYLNGGKLPITNLRDYIDLYVKASVNSGQPIRVVHELCNERWEVACCESYNDFQQVSFVNSVATVKGGKHVEHVVDNITKHLVEIVKKKGGAGINIKPCQVRNHMWVFVNCLIENPTFDSQTKEYMTLPETNFGSKCTLSEMFIDNVSKSGIVKAVISWAKFKKQYDLRKKNGRKSVKLKNVPKLEDANKAGTADAHLCTLILTEGDSAKTFAVAGLGVVGRDLYGVFPLHGKLLNVREASFERKQDNAEINNLVKIIGLQYNKKYNSLEDLKSLRYGKLLIMVDQDQDGSHIKGSLINFIHTNWPELLRLPFLEEFITPIVKAIKKDNVVSFFSLPEFHEWKANTPNHQTYQIKYYKGLGTSTSKEVKEYFQDMERHRISFKYGGSMDDDAIVMAFSKTQVDTRKEWLNWYMDEMKRRKQLGLPERYLYTKTTKEISYSDFVYHELVLFSNTDNIRSIPCMLDGFRPGQRKVLFTCFKRNDTSEVKVAQLSGAVAELSAYHHGEISLQSTIISMAQNFVGSNNINLLEPRAQFGTRLQGGKDSANARYLFTIMSPLARLIFHPDDDPLLQYDMEDGQRTEPKWYIPIIPMLLVNGADGIGTGWSTKIYNHNPREIVQNIRRLLNKERPLPMHPWYKNFKGTIDYISNGRYVTSGNIQILQNNDIEISELPIGTWTQPYIDEVLEALANRKICGRIISDYRSYHTDTTVRFVVTLVPGEFESIQGRYGAFHRLFNLTSQLSTNQMHCLDQNQCLRRFSTSLDILQEYFPIRLRFYQKRKDYLIGQLEAQVERIANQARFILEKCKGEIVLENKKRKTIIHELIERDYRPDPVRNWKCLLHIHDDVDEEEYSAVNEDKKTVDFKNLHYVEQFDYLLSMPMWMLIEEKMNELRQQLAEKSAELEALKTKSIETLWLNDLDEFEKKLNEVEEKERLDEQNIITKHSNDIFADPSGIKVDLKVTEEMTDRITTAVGISVAPKIIRKQPVNIEITVKEEEEDVDEFDGIVEAGVKEPTGSLTVERTFTVKAAEYFEKPRAPKN